MCLHITIRNSTLRLLLQFVLCGELRDDEIWPPRAYAIRIVQYHYVEDITRVGGLYRLNINPDCDSRRDLYEGTV